MELTREVKQLYKDALYYHFIHKEYPREKARFKVGMIFQNL